MKLSIDFSDLQELAEKMEAEPVQWTLDKKSLPEIVDISIELEKGIEIDITKLEIIGGVFSFEGQQLVIYIYDTSNEKEQVLSNPENNVRYHLRDCSKILDMKNQDRFENKYVGTNNTSSIFRTRVYSDLYKKTKEEIESEICVCKLCLKELNYKNYSKNKKVWSDFNLTEFFSEYNSYFSETPKYTCESIPDNEYPQNWDDISRQLRRENKWKCSSCKLDLSDHHNLLHVHHINSARFDNRKSNLKVLCIDCHSTQQGHHNMHYSSFNRGIIRKLKKIRMLLNRGYTNIVVLSISKKI